MIRVELESALAGIFGLHVAAGDERRVAAVVVMLQEVLPEFTGQGRKPWSAIPWLDCAIHLLKRMDSGGIDAVREHVSAARELLQRE